MVDKLVFSNFQQKYARLQQRKSSTDNVSMQEIEQIQQAISQTFPNAEIEEQQFEEQYKNELEQLDIY